MKVQMLSVYDSAAKAFLPPFHAPTLEAAIRQFRYTVQSGQSDLSKFPEDYVLMHIGEFDQETGEITGLTSPHNLGLALSFVEANNDG